MHMALIGGHTDVALLLIDGAAKTDFYSDAALGNADKVRQALAADPSLALRPDGVNHVALDYAAANGRMETAKLLIDAGSRRWTTSYRNSKLLYNTPSKAAVCR